MHQIHPTTTWIATPLGRMLVVLQGFTVSSLRFDDEPLEADPESVPCEAIPLFRAVDAYFRHEQNLPFPELHCGGTPFQRSVWSALGEIPYGETRSYAEIARRIGRPTAIRAVAQAIAMNPIHLLVPCHRVIGADGRLTGFAGGLWRKAWLLDFERYGKAGSSRT